MFSNKSTRAFSRLPVYTKYYIGELAVTLVKDYWDAVYLEPANEWPSVMFYNEKYEQITIFDSNDWSEETINGRINLPIFVNKFFKMCEKVNCNAREIRVKTSVPLEFESPLFRRCFVDCYSFTDDTIKELKKTMLDQNLNSSFLKKIIIQDYKLYFNYYYGQPIIPTIRNIRGFNMHTQKIDDLMFVDALINWIQENKKTTGLANESIKAFKENFNSYFEYENCASVSRIKFYQGYQIDFDVHPELLTEFVKSTRIRILFINTTSSYLTLLRIINLFSNEKIFLLPRDNSNFSESLTCWLNSQYNLFIIEDTPQMGKMLSELSVILNRNCKFINPNKKVILVNQSHQISNDTLHNIDSFDDKGWLTDFSDDVLNDLVTREISFQGFPVKLEDVLDKSTLLETLDTPNLERLIQGWNMKIDKPAETYNHFHVGRTLRRQLVNIEVLNSEFLSKNLVLISNITEEGLSKLKIKAVQYSESENLKSGLFFLNDSEGNLNKFHELCDDRTVNAIYWLEYKESKESNEILLFLKNFSGNVTNFMENLEDSPFSEEINVSEISIPPNNKVNIITDFPGMGKGDLLYYMSRELKKYDPSYWIFFNIFLEKNELDNLSQLTLNKFDHSRLIIFCKFEKLVDLETQDVVVKQIQYLASINCTIWITCNLESRVNLQILFRSAAYRINPFKGPEKFEYFVRNSLFISKEEDSYYKLMNIINIPDPDRDSKIDFTAFPRHLNKNAYGKNLHEWFTLFIKRNVYKKPNYDKKSEEDQQLNLLKEIAANKYNLIKPKLSYSNVDKKIFKLGFVFLEKEKLLFVHNMYKYYFLALYITENFVEKKFMLKVLSEDEYSVVRKFLNNITKHPDDKCLIYNNIIKNIEPPWMLVRKLCEEGNTNLAKFLSDDFYR